MFIELRRRLSELIYPEGPQERRGLERRALTDGLTGLGNKQALMLALPAAEADPNIAVVVFDLNNLGKANKQLGHRRGDALIRRAGRTISVITKRLTGQCRAFRYGGDEFVLLTDAGSAGALIDWIRYCYGPHEIPDGDFVSLSGSVGATFKEADLTLQWRKNKDKRQEKINGFGRNNRAREARSNRALEGFQDWASL